MNRFLLAACLLVATPVACSAQPSDGDCNALPYADDLSNLSLGAVTGTKVNFVASVSDKAGCPAHTDACRRKAFLLDGNTIIFDAATTKAAFVCAAFTDPRGRETDGWLPAANVTPLAIAPNWLGKWKRDTTGEIEIKPGSKGTVHVSGTATYGAGATTHTGDIDADIDPTKAVQSFATGEKQMPYDKEGPYDCAVVLRQLGPYLFVRDNGNCGGMNVSFTGLYARR